MKKSVLLIAIMLLGYTTANAQEFVNFGVKGGVNFSTFAGDGINDFNNPNSRTSFNLGLLAEIPLSEKFSLQPEVLYSGQGYDIADRQDANNIEYQLDYINVPLLAKYYVVDGLGIEFGPQVAFLANSAIDYNPSADSGDISLDSDQFNKVGVDLDLGLSYKFNNGFFINGRYTYGLTDIYDNSFSNNLFSNADARNSVFQAGIGFLF